MKAERTIPVLLAVAALMPCSGNEGVWEISVVDGGGAGQYTSMRADPSGNVHVVYVPEDNNNFPLRYAFWDHRIERWFTMTVDTNAAFTSLVLDSKQRPHISYVDRGGGRLRYARWDGSSWWKQSVPLNAEVVGYYTSIVLDANDNASISFYEYRGPRGSEIKIRLRNVTWNGSRWEVRTIDSTEGSGKFNAMAVDSRENVHLAYANVSAATASMRYAWWNGSVWESEIVDGFEQNNGQYLGQAANIAVDKDGNPHLVYMNNSVASVRYAVRKNGRWHVQVVDRLRAVAYPDRNSIVLDGDKPYISYHDPAMGVLKVAYPEGRNWVVHVVDSGGAGFTSSLQIVNGTLWVSYGDPASGSMKVARRKQSPARTDAAVSQVASQPAANNRVQ